MKRERDGGIRCSAWLGGVADAVVWTITGHHADGAPAADLGLLWCGRICLGCGIFLIGYLVYQSNTTVRLVRYIQHGYRGHHENYGERLQPFGKKDQSHRVMFQSAGGVLGSLRERNVKLANVTHHLKQCVFWPLICVGELFQRAAEVSNALLELFGVVRFHKRDAKPLNI